METIVSNETPVVKTAIVSGRFSGMLGAFQQNAFNTMLACGIDRQVAHKIGVDYGSDIGRMMRNATDDELSSKVAKANKHKESKLTIKGGSRITLSNSMEIVRVCQQMHELRKEGLLASCELPDIAEHLQQYLRESKEWTTTQTWAP